MEALFEEITRYVRFGDTDRAALRELHDHVVPHVPRIVTEFYDRILEHPDARAIFEDDAQVLRLQRTLAEWVSSTLHGPWDREYANRRARIGRVHVQIRLPQRYMFTAMNLIRRRISGVAQSVYADDADRRWIALTAIDKIIDIELAIMLETYHEDYMDLIRRADALERRVLERKLARAEQLASLGTLSAGLAHEIRNPLNAAKLQLLLVGRRCAKDDPAERARGVEGVDVVRTELERLEGLVNDFLTFARPTDLRTSRGDMALTVRGVVDLLTPDAETAGVAIELDCAETLPAHYDDERIKQVLINLTRNAIEAAGSGGTVGICAGAASVGVRIEVTDDGPGVPEDLDIFSPFATSKDHGTGLGLSIVHRIVADHGGDIDFERRGGRTVFALTLPSREE